MRIMMWCVLATLCGAAAAAPSYTVSDASATYAFIINVNYVTLANDEQTAVISPPGFAFTYFGQSYDSFRIGTNGFMELCSGGATGGTTSKTPDHTAAPGCFLSPLWLDLIVSSAAGAVGWVYTQGELVVEWYYVNQFFGPAVQPIPIPGVRMQVRLKPAGIIEFCYGDQSPMVSPQFKADAHAVAISGPSGATQEIIDGAMAGFVGAGVMSAWPADRVIRFTPVTPVNQPPAISVTAGTALVANGGTLNVAHNSMLAQLTLQISVADGDGDSVTLTGAVSNALLTGMLDAEFSSAAKPAPYDVAPATGQFVKATVTHVVALSVDDGKGGTAQFSFSIVVGPDAGGQGQAGAGIVGGGGGACSAGNAAGWALAAPLVLPLLLRRRRKRELNA